MKRFENYASYEVVGGRFSGNHARNILMSDLDLNLVGKDAGVAYDKAA